MKNMRAIVVKDLICPLDVGSIRCSYFLLVFVAIFQFNERKCFLRLTVNILFRMNFSSAHYDPIALYHYASRNLIVVETMRGEHL